MTKFRKDLILQEKTVVHCDSEKKALELLKWAKTENLWSGGSQKNGYETYGEKVCYDLLEQEYSEVQDYEYIDYNILEYKDVIILRGKDKGDEVIFLYGDRLQIGTISLINEYPECTYTIIDKNNITYTKKHNNLWFNSPNLKVEITRNGINVTGEDEPAIKIICPLCNKELSIHHDETAKLKELGVHQCLHNTVISVVGNTLEEVSENLYKFYNLIRDSM